MMLLRLSAAAVRERGVPSHPSVRLPVFGAWSARALREVTEHLERGDCVHVTLMVPRSGRLARRRRSEAVEGRGLSERLADLARAAGAHGSRVMVRFEPEQGALARWWGARARRRGVAGSGHRPGRERRLDELLAAPQRHATAAGDCVGRHHLVVAASAPLSWDVIDELDRCVSAGREAHLVLTVPRSPASRDADLHALWERRAALDVSDREREVAQLWPGTPFVRVEVVRHDLRRRRP